MGVDTEKEGKACSPTVWLQSEGLHGLGREGKTESNSLILIRCTPEANRTVYVNYTFTKK